MIKVGLTGGIGSGKSTVSNMLKELNIPVIDADKTAREILVNYPQALQEIKDEFGNSFFDEKGNLKRTELGNHVFKDNKRKERLEAITHPYIIKEILSKLEQYNKEGYNICVLDAPILIEVGLNSLMDYNILIWVDIDTQVKRVERRDDLSEEQIMLRIKAQMPLEMKKEYVDFIVDNSGDISSTKEQIENILKQILDSEVKK